MLQESCHSDALQQTNLLDKVHLKVPFSTNQPCTEGKIESFRPNRDSGDWEEDRLHLAPLHDEQEVLSVLRNSSPPHLLHAFLALRATQQVALLGSWLCWCLVAVGLFEPLHGCAICPATPSQLDYGDLRMTSTHSASTRAKKKIMIGREAQEGGHRGDCPPSTPRLLLGEVNWSQNLRVLEARFKLLQSFFFAGEIDEH